MSKEDLIKKLSNMKFWGLLSASIAAILVVMHISNEDVNNVSSFITILGSLAVFLFAKDDVRKSRRKDKDDNETN